MGTSRDFGPSVHMILVFAKSAGVPESMASRVDLLDMVRGREGALARV